MCKLNCSKMRTNERSGYKGSLKQGFQNHLGDTPLGVSVRAFPKNFNEERKTYSEYGLCHSMNWGWGPKLNRKEEANWALAFISLFASYRCNVTHAPDALSSCNHAIPMMEPSFKNYKPEKTYLLTLIQDFVTSVRKIREQQENTFMFPFYSRKGQIHKTQANVIYAGNTSF